MRNIVLITNKIYHYRIPIYNYLYSKFLKYNYKFIVITNEKQREISNENLFELIVSDFSFYKYKKLINKLSPFCVIIFLHLTDLIIWPISHWLKIRKIPLIYWNHGINLQDPKNIFKNIFFKYIHFISDSIILYSENELKYISNFNKKKVFIANNTLAFNSFCDVKLNKVSLKRKYNIHFKKVTLFVGRATPRKRLKDLLVIFNNVVEEEYGLIIVGPVLQKEDLELIRGSKNIIYLGAIYDQNKLNEIFNISDVFCIPGTNGLGLVQAFYWGLPAVTENVRHSPEIIYLKDGINGYIVEVGNIKELKEKIWLLLKDSNLYNRFSKNARNTILNEANIEKMFDGFLNSVRYIEDIRKKS